MVQWLTIVAPLLTGAAALLSYFRYKAYITEVQRDLFMNLEGRKYPRVEPKNGIDTPQFEVVNVDVNTSRLRNWQTIVVLKLDREEFPWADSELEDFNFDRDALEPLRPTSKKDVDNFEEVMENELVRLCSITRKSGPKFDPSFMNSVYGPTLFLHFTTTNLFEIKEQLEMVSNALPHLFATWVHTTVGLNTDFFLAGLRELAKSPEILEESE